MKVWIVREIENWEDEVTFEVRESYGKAYRMAERIARNKKLKKNTFFDKDRTFPLRDYWGSDRNNIRIDEYIVW